MNWKALIDANYGRDIALCARDSHYYRPIPDLNPVRHVLIQGRWVRVDGWRKPQRDWSLLRTALICAAITVVGFVALMAGWL